MWLVICIIIVIPYQPLQAVLSSNDYKGKHIVIALLMYRKTIGQRFCTYPKITTIWKNNRATLLHLPENFSTLAN